MVKSSNITLHKNNDCDKRGMNLKVVDRFIEIGAFGENKTVEDILNFVCSHRIHIESLLTEDYPEDILGMIFIFLRTDDFDGCTRSEWERFLNSDLEALLYVF